MRSRADRKFDRCQAKVVEFEEYSFIEDTELTTDSKFIVPVSGLGSVKKVSFKKVPNPDDRGANLFAGLGALLHCPLTEDARRETSTMSNLHSRQIAYNELRKNTAKILCATCRFADMSPIEVAQTRANEARADTELLEVKAVRAKAIAELADVDPAYRNLEN